MKQRRSSTRALGLAAALWLAGPVTAQSEGAFTSAEPAPNTDGYNLLFFGNSYTHSSSNPSVNNPSYGGARGIAELVRQIAMAAGQDAPFAKMVYAWGKGYDYHLDLSSPSLGEIDEPLLGGETWDFVVLQGFSLRTTGHPYLGNPAKHRANGWKLFEQVRAGSANHVLQSPSAVPVLYQTWAREPGHWLYDTGSSWTAGHDIAIGIQNWTGPEVFANAADMLAQVRTSYAGTRAYIDAGTPGTVTRVAPVGDAWHAASYQQGSHSLFASDHYHASSWGDLTTALTIYGTIWDDTNTSSVIASGNLDPILAAIGVSNAEALQIAGNVDLLLPSPPVAAPPVEPAPGILVDFSAAAGSVAGAEIQPWAGRHYNLISDLAAGAAFDVVNTSNVPTGIDVVITDGFAGETSGGATGAWKGAKSLSGSLYEEGAQLDSFFVGTGSGFTDDTARIEVRGLDPLAQFDFVFHGSRNNEFNTRRCFYSIGGTTVTLDAAYNLNLVATIPSVVPSPTGVVEITITNGGVPHNFAYLGVLQITGCGAVSYCTAGTSSSGCQALLGASGTPSASAPSGFVLSATTVEGGKDALFFFGTGGRQANPWGSGTSFQCVVPPVRRAGLLPASGTPGACDGAFSQDFNAHWTGKPGSNPGAGAVVQAQLWYRDPQNTSNQTTSLSNAIEFCVLR